MALSSLTLMNFQGYKKCSISFDPGVNAITGPSDSGKTALIRAMRWTITNQPLGDAFRSNWDQKGETYSIIEVDGLRVGRAKKGTAQNLYTLDGEPFKAFGAGVPEEVKAFLNIHDVNLQPQITSPFLLSGMSPGEVGRYFNRIAKIEKIDSAISTANGKIQSDGRSLYLKEAELEQDVARLAEFAWVDEADGYLAQLEATEADIHRMEVVKVKIKSNVVAIIGVNQRLKKIKYHLTASDEIERLMDVQAEIRAGNIEWGEINNVLNDIDETEKGQQWASALIEAKPDMTALIFVSENIQRLINESEILWARINNIKISQKKLDQAKQKKAELTATWYDLMGDTCALCGGSI